jgi:putative transposase
MAPLRHTVEQILAKLREAEVALSKGQAVAQVCRTLGITEQTYYHWRNEYGGLKVDQAKRLKDLEQENTRLKRAVADLLPPPMSQVTKSLVSLGTTPTPGTAVGQ